ncbi:MAG: hypothetical protein IID28_03350 [Planctomycetes bacterium]|nr:hypothetical protein [Planctomycetota bacterium]
MSQFNTPVRRGGGDLDVYTAILGTAFLVLLTGVFLVATANMKHSAPDGGTGSMFKLVD